MPQNITQPNPEDIETFEHPTLGTLKFPKVMGASDRNAIIDQMESERKFTEKGVAENPSVAPTPKPGKLDPSYKPNFAERLASSDVPGSFEGHPENIGSYVPATIGEVAGGAKDLASGYIEGGKKGALKQAKGLHRIVGGGMNAAAPFIPLSAAAAPISTAVALGIGVVGQKAGEKAGDIIHAPQEVKDLMGDAGALGVGYLSVKIPKAIGKATASTRQAMADDVVSPLTYEGVNEAGSDARMGITPEHGITKEGLVGGKKKLMKSSADRVTAIKQTADQILQNHPNGRNIIDVEPIIDGAIDAAINSSKRVAGSTGRLNKLRTALKTRYGNISGTPLEMNNLATDIQSEAAPLGAYKNTQPVESNVSSAMSNVARRIRDHVNTHVPEVKELNGRMADILDARAGIQRAIDRGKGESVFGSFGRDAFSSTLDKTLGSASVRTRLAKAINRGNILDIPTPPSAPPPVVTPPGQVAGGAGARNPIRGLLPPAGRTAGPRTSAGPGTNVYPANPRPGANLTGETHSPDTGGFGTAAVRFLHPGGGGRLGSVPSVIPLPEGTTNPPLPFARRLTEGTNPPPRVNTLIDPSRTGAVDPNVYPQTAPDAPPPGPNEPIRLPAAPDPSGPVDLGKPTILPQLQLPTPKNRLLPARGQTSGPKTVSGPSGTTHAMPPVPGPTETVAPYLSGKHDFALFTAENPGTESLPPSENKVRTALTIAELRKMGLKPQLLEHNNEGKVGTSIFVPNMTTEASIGFQEHMKQKFGHATQSSIVTKQGLVDPVNKKVSPIDFSKTVFGPDAQSQPFHSVAGVEGDKLPFSFNPHGEPRPIASPYEGIHYMDQPIQGNKLMGDLRARSGLGADTERVRAGYGVPGVYASDAGAISDLNSRKSFVHIKGDKAIAEISETKDVWGPAVDKAGQEAKASGADPKTVTWARQKAMEQSLRDAGYDGIRDSKIAKGTTFFFGDVEAMKPGTVAEVPELAPHPNAPQPPQPKAASHTSHQKASTKTAARSTSKKPGGNKPPSGSSSSTPPGGGQVDF